jgi:hypothetical protein
MGGPGSTPYASRGGEGRRLSLFKILIDTCVCLDLVKDCQQQAILAALEELIRQGDIDLILPRTGVDELARNKARLIEENSRSLSNTLKRVKKAVEKFGDPRQKAQSVAPHPIVCVL